MDSGETPDHEIEIPFELRRRPGVVRVSVSANRDPARWGFDLLGVEMDWHKAAGFPVVSAEVLHDSEGYAAWLAWLQVITVRDTGRPERDGTMVDRPHQLEGSDVPFFTSGILPRLFDAPAQEGDDLDFYASALLAYTPDAVISRALRPVCGFRWGYEVRDGEISCLVPEAISGGEWAKEVDVLRGEHPSWAFAS